jgi:hypothetical protein
MSLRRHCFTLVLCIAAGAAAANEGPRPAEFAWRATLDTGGRSGPVRVELPTEALARLQSAGASDLRVFDARGQAVPFAAWTPPPAAVPAPSRPTRRFAALPLYSADGSSTGPRGAIQVRIAQDGARPATAIEIGLPADTPAAAATQRLPAALFDTRGQQQAVSGLVLQARLPPNVPVRFSVATSPDLAHWTPVAVQGRVYRFEGEGAPANDRLAFAAPLVLKDQYLRLDWAGQAGVAVEAVSGLLPTPQPPAGAPSLALGPAAAEDDSALEWRLAFATPIRRLELRPAQPNTLLPVRVLGRRQPSEPWRVLAQGLVYRLGEGAGESRSAPLELAPASVRWLRVEATHGAHLPADALEARVQFEPLALVFVAGAQGPYQLAAGHGRAGPTALTLAQWTAATQVRPEDLPVARIAGVQATTEAAPAWLARWLPPGIDARTATLWLVLGTGVLVLGGVAWALLHQLGLTRRNT